MCDDGGKTWEARDHSQWMVWRPFYFARLIVDPNNPDRVFKDDGALILSEDGGNSFSVVGGFERHARRLARRLDRPDQSEARDRPATTAACGSATTAATKWWKGENLPISQFYHVSVDDEDPYHVYGGLQDNSSWVGDSAYPGGITNSRWENMYGGDGFWMFADPADPDYVYAEYQGGDVGRVNRTRTRCATSSRRQAPARSCASTGTRRCTCRPNEKGTLYIGAQFLFRSRDHGQTWERISPDLTTNDPEKQSQEQSGGVTVDNSSAEMHTTIYSISESPKDAGTIWVGTDDGNLQLTRDGGKTWTNVAGNRAWALPKASWVSWVEASRYDAATAYAAFDRHTFGDMTRTST